MYRAFDYWSAQSPTSTIHTPLFRVLFAGGSALLVDGAVEFWGVLG